MGLQPRGKMRARKEPSVRLNPMHWEQGQREQGGSGYPSITDSGTTRSPEESVLKDVLTQMFARVCIIFKCVIFLVRTASPHFVDAHACQGLVCFWA